jgi:hypothetical protein
MVDRAVAAVQLELLKQLADQSQSYRLIAGQDVLDSPETVSRLLLETVEV